MTKQELYAKLATVVKSKNSTPDQIKKAKILTQKLITNSISTEDALMHFNSIKSLIKHPMLDKIISKPVGKSLVKYYNNELTDEDTIKMLSSLITHSVIEKQHTGNDHADSICLLSSSLQEYVQTRDRLPVDIALESVGLSEDLIIK